MPFDFPNTPTVGQAYTPEAGVTFVWDGGSWNRASPAVGNYVIPAGIIMPFAGDLAPVGALMCYGQEFSRANLAALFAVIGTRYGAGNGTTTANLPDLRGRTVLGRDEIAGGGAYANRVTNAGVGSPGIDSKVLGAGGGADRWTLTAPQVAAHAHAVNATTGTESVWHTHTGLSGGANQDHQHWNDAWTEVAGDHQHSTNGFYTAGAGGNVNYRASGPIQDKSGRATDIAGAHQHHFAFASGWMSAQHNHYFTTDNQNVLHTHNVSVMSSNAGGNEAHPIVQPILVLNYIIFTGATV